MIKIDGLEDIQKTLDKTLFDKVFTTTSNEIITGAINKAKTQIKKRWSIDLVKANSNEWAFANKGTGRTNKRNGRLKIHKATLKNGYYYLHISGTPLNLSLFEFTWKQEVSATKSLKKKKSIGKQMKVLGRKGRGSVRVKIQKKHITTLQTAFVATMKNGHRGIFQRRSNGNGILEKRSITPQSMFKQVDFNQILSDHINANLMKRFMHNLERKTGGKY